MSHDATSLWQKNPRRWDVPLCLLGCLVLLIIAQVTPVLSIKKFVFWKDDYSLFSGTIGLFRDRHYGLALLIFFFSILFPFAKIVTLYVLWFVRFSNRRRLRLLFWLEVLGRWSMLDVFVVAIIVVIAKSGGALEARPLIGIYLFAGAVLASLLMTYQLRSLARRAAGKS